MDSELTPAVSSFEGLEPITNHGKIPASTTHFVLNLTGRPDYRPVRLKIQREGTLICSFANQFPRGWTKKLYSPAAGYSLDVATEENPHGFRFL